MNLLYFLVICLEDLNLVTICKWHNVPYIANLAFSVTSLWALMMSVFWLVGQSVGYFFIPHFAFQESGQKKWSNPYVSYNKKKLLEANFAVF